MRSFPSMVQNFVDERILRKIFDLSCSIRCQSLSTDTTNFSTPHSTANTILIGTASIEVLTKQKTDSALREILFSEKNRYLCNRTPHETLECEKG